MKEQGEDSFEKKRASWALFLAQLDVWELIEVAKDLTKALNFMADKVQEGKRDV